jgi:general secretion pathway protein J
MSPSILPRSCSEERRCAASAGFTLIEVLVAVSIAAIVLTSVYGVFTGVSSAKIRLEADSEAYHRARIIFDRLGREIRGAVPIGGTNGKGVFLAGLDGQGEPFLELTTTAVAQPGEGNTGIALIHYGLAEDRERPQGKNVLMRSEHSALQSEATSASAGMMRLAPGIEQLQLRFYTGSDWRSEWDASADGLPALVELSLAMIDSEGRSHRFFSAFELPGITWK